MKGGKWRNKAYNTRDSVAEWFDGSIRVPYKPRVSPSTPKFKKYILSIVYKEKGKGEVVRIGSIIIFHSSKLWKAKFFILCDVIFLVRLQGKFLHWSLYSSVAPSSTHGPPSVSRQLDMIWRDHMLKVTSTVTDSFHGGTTTVPRCWVVREVWFTLTCREVRPLHICPVKRISKETPEVNSGQHKSTQWHQ